MIINTEIIDINNFLEEHPKGLIVLLYPDTSKNIVTNTICMDDKDNMTISEKSFQSIVNNLKSHFSILPTQEENK